MKTGLLAAAAAALIAAVTVPAAAVAAEPVAATIGTPSFPHAARATNTAIRVTWGKVAGADGYVVYKYDKKAKKFAAERVLSADRKSWVDKGEPTGKLQRYRIAAYTTVDGKRLEGKPTYQVSALAYRKNDKVVNAGAIKAVDVEGAIGQPFVQIPSRYTIDMLNVGYTPLKVEPSAWGKAKAKTVVDSRVRARILSGEDVIDLAMYKPGAYSVGVEAKKLGEAKVLVIAHNGNHKTVTVRIKDFAHADFGNLAKLDDNSPQYLLLTDYAQLIGDIVQRCLDVSCYADASLDDETGDLVVTPDADPVLAALCEKLLDEFPYPIKISLAASAGVNFTMWQDPDKAANPEMVKYIVRDWPGDDDDTWIPLAPFWFTWP
ncbi:MAG: hypothetical protein LBR32_05155 [Propionibacteriaceae bacterium]|jgi:hypothetical protein|nr:hypothetical protein [Propionibacteriaceae bacterium]